MKHDYTKLDAAILAALRVAPLTFSVLQDNRKVKKESDAIETAHNNGVSRRHVEFKPAWRFIDSRLQALRKRGKIRFDSKQGWIAE